jgi:hypothetical protein
VLLDLSTRSPWAKAEHSTDLGLRLGAQVAQQAGLGQDGSAYDSSWPIDDHFPLIGELGFDGAQK